MYFSCRNNKHNFHNNHLNYKSLSTPEHIVKMPVQNREIVNTLSPFIIKLYNNIIIVIKKLKERLEVSISINCNYQYKRNYSLKRLFYIVPPD